MRRALILFGADEPGLRLSGRVLADSMPNATLAGVAEAGQFSFVERPADFVARLRRFLAEHPVQPRRR